MNSIQDDPTNSCLIFSLALDGQGGARAVPSDYDGDSVTWMHGDYSLADTRSWLANQGIDDRVIETLTRSDTRPRTLKIGTGHLILLRGVNLNPGADPDDMVSVRFWIDANRVISLRQRRLYSIEDVRADLLAGSGPCDVGELLTSIVERMATRISDFVDAVEEKVEGFEQSIESGASLSTRLQVSATRQQIAHVRRYLAPQREALEALQRGMPDWLSEYAHAIGEQSDRVAHYIEGLDLARDSATLLQEDILNRIAMQQNERTYVLSIVAVVFLPITFITGLFGMNVGGLPGVDQPDAFWWVAACMSATSLGVIAWLAWKRWF